MKITHYPLLLLLSTTVCFAADKAGASLSTGHVGMQSGMGNLSISSGGGQARENAGMGAEHPDADSGVANLQDSIQTGIDD